MKLCSSCTASPRSVFPAVALGHSDDALYKYVRRVFGVRRHGVFVPDIRFECDVAVQVDVARDGEGFHARYIVYGHGIPDFYVARSPPLRRRRCKRSRLF